MKVGDLIRYIQPNFKDTAQLGLVVCYDDKVFRQMGDLESAMLEVLFAGSSSTRWVHIQDCEVVQ